MPTGVMLSPAALAALSPPALAEVMRAILPPGAAVSPVPDPASGPAPGPDAVPPVDEATGLANLTLAQGHRFLSRHMAERPRALVELFARQNRNVIPDTEALAAVGAEPRGGLGGALAGLTNRGRNVTGNPVDVIHYRRGHLSISPATLEVFRRVLRSQGVEL